MSVLILCKNFFHLRVNTVFPIVIDNLCPPFWYLLFPSQDDCMIIATWGNFTDDGNFYYVRELRIPHLDNSCYIPVSLVNLCDKYDKCTWPVIRDQTLLSFYRFSLRAKKKLGLRTCTLIILTFTQALTIQTPRSQHKKPEVSISAKQIISSHPKQQQLLPSNPYTDIFIRFLARNS